MSDETPIYTETLIDSVFDDDFKPVDDGHLYPWNLRVDIDPFATITDGSGIVVHHPACHALEGWPAEMIHEDSADLIRKQWQYNLDNPKDTRVQFHRCTINRKAKP